VATGCLDESTVLAFLGGSLPAPQRASLEKHIAGCVPCADLLTWAAADQASVSRAPGDEGRPFFGQLQPGARVGRYQILGAIGRGGMGEVYAAYHPDLDRRIALKVVAGASRRTGERRARLLREARAIARLSHPNVVTVHDAGTFGDRVFIAMELVDGSTIDQWLDAAPRTWRQILEVFIAAGRGLAAAHAADVIHRDFKPQNVMIASSGAVRVMDFGLARLTADPTDGAGRAGEDEPTVWLTHVTKTGAFIGTPAYMSPEQFRREPIDARSDQFSFCVALHEALFGSRPPAAPGAGVSERRESTPASRPAAIPIWLRAVVLRGASAERDGRYPSMNALLAALERGRGRAKRRVSIAAVAACALILGAGAWRVARGNRFACTVPEDRLSAVWSTRDATNSRRQSIHHAFTASGRATAETSWERVSRVLDEYITAWSAMYVQACEATHVRGEQSAEVLDLRMSCLNDNLDQVRALTDTLASAHTPALSHAVSASKDLTPVARCGEVSLLRSAIPLPREDRTLHEVQRLRRALAEVEMLWDVGDVVGVLKRTNALRPEVEATGYKPLLGELLYYIGLAESDIDENAATGDATLRRAMLVAEAARDDRTAAKICTSLVFVSGYRLGRIDDAKFWAEFARAILDRSGVDDPRLRSWIDTNWGGALARAGDFEAARFFVARSAEQKERLLGKEHPDYAISLGELSYVLARAGRASEALDFANRSIEIFVAHGDPDAFMLGVGHANQGDALFALGRFSEADAAYQRALVILTTNVGHRHPEAAFALQGLGEIRLLQRKPLEAVRLIEDALSVRQRPHADPVLAAESEFGLARALWESGGDRGKARRLAAAALGIYTTERRPSQERAVRSWLTDHRRN